MIKGKVVDAIKDHLEEWLLGFNPDRDLNIGIFSSEKVNIKNAIINADRVNKEMKEAKAPIRLKAGMIGKISVKVSINYDNLISK